MEYRVQAFESISDEVISLAGGFSREMSPDFVQLAAFANASSTPLRIVAVFAGDTCIALSCCTIENQRLVGLRLKVYRNVGARFYDYTSLDHAQGCRDALLQCLIADARKVGVDGVFLNNVLTDDASQPAVGSLYTKQTAYYQADGEQELYASLLRKKSVKRHVNKCMRELEYRCEHLVGDEISASHIESLGAMHIETRRFHGTESAFNRPETQAEYLASRGSRVLTRVLHGDEVIACHYGLLFADKMIWHTPVVNIKFLAYSPLEVLLYETISYCRENGITVFDLGIGDEPYKQRFSNSRREVRDIFVPVSWKAKLAGLAKDAEYRYSLRDVFSPHLSTIKGVVQSSFPELCAGLGNYVSAPGFEFRSGQDCIKSIDNFSDFVEFCRREDLHVTAAHYQHFRNKAKFAVLLNRDEEPLVYGWQSRAESLRLPELQRGISSIGGVLAWNIKNTELANEQDLDRFIRQLVGANEGKKLFVLVRKSERALKAYLGAAGFQRTLLSFV